MKTKKEIIGKVLELMEDFVSEKISGEKLVDLYIPFWKHKLRGKMERLFSNREIDILNELHSDCDCLNYPIEDESSRRISLTEDQLREVVKLKLSKLKGLQK